MGRKSQRRLRRKGKEGDPLDMHDELMALDVDKADRSKGVKQDSKLRRRERKKQLKKELKQNEHIKRHGEKDKTKHTGWHIVKVQGGSIVEKDFLFSSIGNVIEVEFQPLGFHKVDNMICFYLEANGPAASAISSLNKRVQGSDGSRLKITVTKSNTPDLVLNSDQLSVLREVMSSRFNPEACLLDLTDLHHDPVLIEKDILAPLSSPTVMKQIFRLIRENIPQLKALNLSKNNLRSANLKLLQAIHASSSLLSALNLEHNYIADIQVLKLIKMFPLTELSLQFNPIVSNYKENPLKYIMAMKKDLEYLKLLDGVDVNAYIAEKMKTKIQESQQIVAELGESVSSSSSNAGNVSEPLVRTFLEQYYALIDTQQRGDLVAAYTPDAVLEVKSSISSIVSRIFVGHSLIREAFATLPATQHQHSTFSLDIQSLSINTAQVVVTGQCKIADVDTIVTFSRSMVIVPFNTGLCCSQDVLELR